jgi:small subunit ribosomal protein S3
VNVIIYTARPGVLVGRKGVRVDQLKQALQQIAGTTCHLTLHEVKRPELEAKLVAEVIAEALEKRMAFRRAMKRAIQTTIQAGAKGVKVELNGRLGGAEMARQAKEREGRVPLSTLQAHVDYGTAQGQDHLWRDRRQGVDLQGRHRPRADGRFPPGASRARGGRGERRPRPAPPHEGDPRCR